MYLTLTTKRACAFCTLMMQKNTRYISSFCVCAFIVHNRVALLLFSFFFFIIRKWLQKFQWTMNNSKENVTQWDMKTLLFLALFSSSFSFLIRFAFFYVMVNDDDDDDKWERRTPSAVCSQLNQRLILENTLL